MRLTLLSSTTALLFLAASSAATSLPQSLADIERRWSAGETEVCRPELSAPGCYIFAWWHSMVSFCHGSAADSTGPPGASIHSGTTHRDATPAWPVQRDADDAGFETRGFAYATDERTMMMQAQKRDQTSKPLLQRMKNFVHTFYRQRGEEKGTVVTARGEELEDAAPVLKPKRGMKYAFTA